MGTWQAIRWHEKYPALTGIRAVGAAVVFFDHFPFDARQRLTVNVLSFFFVLSGFLIVRLYFDDARPFSKGFTQYFVNRFARIYPVYFLLLTIAIILRPDHGSLLLFKNYTLTQALFNNSSAFVIQPAWSVTVEECFYFLAPAIMLVIRRFGFLSSIVCMSLLSALAITISFLPISFLHTPQFVLSTTFFGHYVEFYAGILLALIIIKREKTTVYDRQGYFYTVCGSLGILFLIGAMMYVYSKPVLDHSAIILINNFLIPIPVATLYYGLICERSIFSKMLSSRLLNILGKSSYAFYLLHSIVIKYVSIPFLQQHIQADRTVCVVVTFLVIQVLSLAIYLFYEQPLNKGIRKKFAAFRVSREILK